MDQPNLSHANTAEARRTALPIKWFTNRDWVQHRKFISHMYIRQQKPLKEIKETMEQEFHLRATERMFKARFKAWNLQKNLRPDEALAMVRVKARRDAENTTSEFWKHGSIITFEKLERYLRENHHVLKKAQKFVSEDLAMDSGIESLLPPHVIVLSPQNPMRTETGMYSAESAVSALQGLRGSYWQLCRGVRIDPFEPMKAMALFRRAIYSFRSRSPSRQADGWHYLQMSFGALHSDLITDSWCVTLTLVNMLPLILYSEYPEVGRTVADYVMELYLHLFGQNFPFRIFLDQLVGLWSRGQLSAEYYCLLYETLENVLMDEVEGRYGYSADVLVGEHTFPPSNGQCLRCQSRPIACTSTGRSLSALWRVSERALQRNKLQNSRVDHAP